MGLESDILQIGYPFGADSSFASEGRILPGFSSKTLCLDFDQVKLVTTLLEDIDSRQKAGKSKSCFEKRYVCLAQSLPGNADGLFRGIERDFHPLREKQL